MRRPFRPVVTMLEGRQLLSSTSRHVPGDTLIESKTTRSAHSITGTLNGTFGYSAPPNNNPSNYGMEFRSYSGQLNTTGMGGVGTIVNSTSGLSPLASGFNLGKLQGPSNGRVPLDQKTDHLLLDPLDAPFPPSLTVPSSFDLLVRVKSANGVFKHDVDKVLSLTMVQSNETNNSAYLNFNPTLQFELDADVTATVQPVAT
jgi:hypothetical protein